jgi:hypothetical protein
MDSKRNMRGIEISLEATTIIQEIIEVEERVTERK